MKEAVTDLLQQLRGAQRFSWHAVALAWAVAVLGWTIIFLLPNQYEARARVYVDAESVLKPLLQGLAVGTDVTSEVSMMASALLSRPNLEMVVKETGLSQRAGTELEHEALIASLPKRIIVEPGTPRNMYTIRFSDTDPIMAQRVVQTVLNVFVSSTVGSKRADSDNAQQFLEQQIKEYEQRLSDAEDRLAEFKRQNVGLMPGETGDYFARLQAEMAMLVKLREAHNLADRKRAELQRQLEGEEPTFGLMSAGTTGTSAIDGRLADLRAKLDSLLVQYTDRHPEVVSIRETIAQLEVQRLNDRGAALNAASVPVVGGDVAKAAALHALDINPVYQSTKIGLGQVELELVGLRSQIDAGEARVQDLRSKVTTVPEVEAQLARLNRDYEVNRAQHTALLQRLESARLTDEADRTGEQSKFQIAEPPVRPLKPSAPNRPLFSTAVLLIALVAGSCLAMVLNVLRPVFGTRLSLAEATGLKVIASVSLIDPSRGWHSQRNLILIGSIVLLMFAYTGVIVLAAAVVGAA